MYVRLAFSVAAHLDPEIFVIDEVLAVGDAAFQKKCLGKMRSVASAGSTVLLVSHNMGVMQTLASKAIWLDRGHMAFTGEVAHAISSYLSLGKSSDGLSVDITDHPNRFEIENTADRANGAAEAKRHAIFLSSRCNIRNTLR
jgi:lipopolysaccharide transport system ATP-binding protein